MEASRKEVLAAAGINLEEVLERLMGSDTLLERLLGKFAADGNYRRLEEAMAAGIWRKPLPPSHTLKGMCGNLGMGELFSLFTLQVEAPAPGGLAGRLPADGGDCPRLWGDDTGHWRAG